MENRDDPPSPAQSDSTAFPVEPIDVPDADLIIRSSDLVDFRVHKSVLAMASPSLDLEDQDSLLELSGDEFIYGLQLSEDSDLLNSLISILYPVPTVIPKSYEKVLYLLVTC